MKWKIYNNKKMLADNTVNYNDYTVRILADNTVNIVGHS